MIKGIVWVCDYVLFSLRKCSRWLYCCQRAHTRQIAFTSRSNILCETIFAFSALSSRSNHFVYFYKISVRRLLVNWAQHTYDLKIEISTIFHTHTVDRKAIASHTRAWKKIWFFAPRTRFFYSVDILRTVHSLSALRSLLVFHSKINYFLLLIGVRVYNIFRFVAFNANEMI